VSLLRVLGVLTGTHGRITLRTSDDRLDIHQFARCVKFHRGKTGIVLAWVRFPEAIKVMAGANARSTPSLASTVDRYRRLLRSDRDDVVGDAVGLNNQRPFELRLTHGDRLGSKVDDAMVFGLGVMLTSILIGIIGGRGTLPLLALSEGPSSEGLSESLSTPGETQVSKTETQVPSSAPSSAGSLDDRFHESCHKRGIHLGFRAPI
jgi:hypothetical protein